jgi:hypothetical protein
MAGAPDNITPAALGSYSPSISGYAPADFLDAEDTRPPEIALDPTGTGNYQPYSTLVRNVLNRHTVEIKDRSNSIPPITLKWRNRMRDFFFHRNEELIKTLKRPLASHTLFSQTENFIRKFGRADFMPTHNSLNNVFLDNSGVSYVPQITSEMQNIGPATIPQLIDQIRWVYDAYRETGEQLFKKEVVLKEKVEALDSIYKKVVSFMTLHDEPESGEIAESIQKLLKRKFEENTIEQVYDEIIALYRRFYVLREIIHSLRGMDSVDKEPLCSICLNEPVAYALTPCGHTFCSTCSKRQITQCFMCRVQVKEKIKIFF